MTVALAVFRTTFSDAEEMAPEELLRQVSVEYEASLQVTWYKPVLKPLGDQGFQVYPYVGRHDDGRRWLRLEALMRREDWAFVETLHFLIDATPTDIRLDKLNDVDTDSSSGTSSEMVDLGEQDPLIRRIAKAKEVQVSFLGPKRRDHYLLTAEDLENFRRMITLERKRSERTQRPFVLLLMDTGRNLLTQKNGRILLDILSALQAATRETDVMGWYESNSVVGVMFTEITPDNNLILSTILSRIGDALRGRLTTEQFSQLKFSFHLFPEEWDPTARWRLPSPMIGSNAAAPKPVAFATRLASAVRTAAAFPAAFPG